MVIIWAVIIVPEMTYNMSSGTLNPTYSSPDPHYRLGLRAPTTARTFTPMTIRNGLQKIGGMVLTVGRDAGEGICRCAGGEQRAGGNEEGDS